MGGLQENLQKISPKEIAQTPLAYSLYVVVLILVSVIVGQRVDAITTGNKCDEDVKYWKDVAYSERSEKNEIFKAYYVERTANEQIKKIVDSTAITNHKKNEK